MPRIGNARTIADMEFVIDAPSFGADRSAWISHGVEGSRDRHRFDAETYSYIFEVLQLSLPGTRRDGWHVVIGTELWRFGGSKSEARRTKSLRVIAGLSADVLTWMRKNRSAKLDEVTLSGREA